MMRQVVMALGNVEERIGPIAELVGERKCGDARGIAAKRQHQQIAEQFKMFSMVGGNPFGSRIVRNFPAPFLGENSLVSTSRTADRYSSSLRQSSAPSWPRSRAASSATKSSTLFRSRARCCRARRFSFLSSPENSRSKTMRGSTSGGSGVDSDFQERFEV